ncbi:hypothetical protein J2S74_002632 [Evansella vedderi]|uniref:DUF2515 domain-containing protein n=1 Tax=Evansella vedderi TaxID=38282 RepID=A0ABT9ZYR2_9BACI|nr:DUF2515 family protein [Evansella vedderi]MDQ0255250.1 hypothetical protein [Evansella vedderi]
MKDIYDQWKRDIFIEKLRIETIVNNKENVSRTLAYQKYYTRNPEITWAYLASMVSRNAGWNMGDLWSKPFRTILSKEKRHHIFTTYERANWMIFSDAYPQLLVYEWSKKIGKPLFNYLREFHVSEWMIEQWKDFWVNKNRKKLLYALIINEQHLIQQPVIEALFFKKKVFQSLDYILQERLHFSVVLLPTKKGEIYGRSIKDFNNVNKRVELGVHLAWILLESPQKNDIYNFFCNVEFTGSRKDYQQWQTGSFYRTPRILDNYPYIFHKDEKRKDWSKDKNYSPNKLLRKRWSPPRKFLLTEWYKKKQGQIMLTATVVSLANQKNLFK